MLILILGASLVNPLWALAAVEAANTAGSFFSQGDSSGISRQDARFINNFNMEQSLRNEKWERAKYVDALSIRAADAERAGLHPLAALGVNVASGPVSGVFATQPGETRSKWPSSSLSALGQNVSRAMTATQTADERLMSQALLEKVRTETDLVRTQIAESQKRLLGSTGPPMPDPYGPGSMTSDVRELPNQHMIFRGPDGYSTEWNPNFAMSMMGRSIKGTLQDLHDLGRYNLGSKLRAVRSQYLDNRYISDKQMREYGEWRKY